MASFLEFIRMHIFHIAPILIAGFVGVAIIVERMHVLVWVYPMHRSNAFFEKIRDLIMADRIGEAIVFCDKYRLKPVAQVVKEGLMRAHQPETLIEHGLEIAASEQSQKVMLRTSFLATIANVSTLLGLFGTILGLIQSFDAVGAASAQQRSALLASGISTAMNATMLGLAVAIPCMVAFSFLMNRANRLNADLERSAVKVLDLLKQRYFGVNNLPSGELSSVSKAI